MDIPLPAEMQHRCVSTEHPSDPLGTARRLIHEGRYTEAHRLLLALLAGESDGPSGDCTPEVLLLLGWTAPSRTSARAFFQRLISIYPYDPLARDGLGWTETGWDALPADPVQGGGAVHLQHNLGNALPADQIQGSGAVQLQHDVRPRSSAVPLRPTPPRTLGLLGLYLLGLALAESVTAFLHPQLGLAIHSALLVLLFLHAALWATGPLQNQLYCLALAPLIRLLSLSMPLAQLQPVFWYAIIGLPLFLATLLALRLTGYTPAEVGLSPGRFWPLQALTGLSGLGLGYLEYRILHPAPLAPSFTPGAIWLPALILLIFTGLLEELIFRGLMQRASQELLGNLGPVYISLAFAVLHIGYRSLADFAFVFAVGLIFSLVAGRSRSIWGVTLAHGLTNIALFLVFPFILR